MGRRNSDLPKPVMKKPKWKIGDVVDVEFLGVLRKCEIIKLSKNKHDVNRWVYIVVDHNTNTIIPFVGVKDTERWANIKIVED
jgi:hypothetical protein